jgi:sortase A
MRRGGITRREFLARLSGNGLLAVGGTLLGASAAYGIYKDHTEANLKSLKRGSLLTSAAPAQAGAQQPPADAATQTIAASATATGNGETSGQTSGASSAASAAATSAAAPPVAVEPDKLKPLKLTIDTIGLVNAPVIGTGTKLDKGVLIWDVADHAVGYLLGTGLPGQPGNLVLSGHISAPLSGQGNIFHDLPALANRLGARASVQAADGVWYYYKITGTDVVLPADSWVLNPTQGPTITLLTCYPDGVYDHRFVAQGTYIGHS